MYKEILRVYAQKRIARIRYGLSLNIRILQRRFLLTLLGFGL